MIISPTSTEVSRSIPIFWKNLKKFILVFVWIELINTNVSIVINYHHPLSISSDVNSNRWLSAIKESLDMGKIESYLLVYVCPSIIRAGSKDARIIRDVNSSDHITSRFRKCLERGVSWNSVVDDQDEDVKAKHAKNKT